ncbi:hypothetical protein EAY10_17785 [Vibrio anguillarum]|nr:hypothetical protein [Vibrio anguillarum]MBF4395055.1 hypothetical protein [Vibrio anguillarum]
MTRLLKCSPKQATDNWDSVIDVLLPFVEHLNSAIINGLKNTSEIEQAVATFNSLVKSTRQFNAPVFDEFKRKVEAP